MVTLDRVPQGMLFSGASGSGKTSAARILANQLDYDFSQVIEIDAASNRGVDNIRSLIETLRYSSGGNFIILDEAHNLTREAFNALLKTLEEPTQGTVFILLTTDPSKIPDTVKSRLMEFEFRKISTADILSRLMHVAHEEGIEVEEALLKLLAERADGNLRSALVSLELVWISEITSVEDYQELIGETDFAPILLRAMVRESHATVLARLSDILSIEPSPQDVTSKILATLRDLLILRSGGELPHDGPALANRRELSSLISRDGLLSAIKLVWDLRTRLRPSDDPRGSLEMTVILMSEILSRDAVNVPPAVVPSNKNSASASPRLSVDEMRGA